jgi:hypothetical protein
VNNLSILVQRGSDTAIAGFSNERDVVNKFNQWKSDIDAQTWLHLMGYDIEKIEKVEAVKITGSHKADVQVKIKIYMKDLIAAENISIKLVSNPTGFNQIDKRWIDKYKELWAIPDDIVKILKHFTGQLPPYVSLTKDPRRMFLYEMDEHSQKRLLSFFTENKILVISEILKGTDKFAANWMLIYLKYSNTWSLLPISVVMNFYGEGDVRISPRGGLIIGRIGMQRKGGDNGRESSKMLQFKVNPALIVKESLKT